jgi:phage baseplate assembly protein W
MAANQTTVIRGKLPTKYNSQLPKSQRKVICGLSFPLGSNGSNYFSKQSGINMIRSSVKQLLMTETGERVMLPNYGCNLRKYLFEPLDDLIFDSIKREIEFSFANYIRGATLQKIAVFPTGDLGPAGGNSLIVNLTLKLNSDDLEIFDVEVFIS